MASMPLPLRELFPDEDYRFHLTLRKGDAAGFFAGGDHDVLMDRAHWLRQGADHYLGFIEGAEPLIAELEVLTRTWTGRALSDVGAPRARLLQLGQTLEADFMLLREIAPGDFRLHAGVVCFPSSWDPAEKFGLGLEAIHGVVPRLNPTMGATIGTFLQKLKPGAAFERANWGLAATSERNLHPHRLSPRLKLPLDVNKIWVRIEDQILAALPETRGILFGITLRIIPLTELLADPGLKRGLKRALETMPADVAAYKGLAEIRGALLDAMTDRIL